MKRVERTDFLLIDRRDALSCDEFVEQYAMLGKPVVLTGLMQDWEAARLWNFEYFKRRHGDVTIAARCSDDYERTITMPLAAYIDSLGNPHMHFYLKDWVFEDDIPDLLAQYRVPRHFVNWTRRLPDKWQPKWRWLYIGPASSASHLHVDFLLTSAWNALFVGSKRWLVYSPDQAQHMYRGAVDAFCPDLGRFPLFTHARGHMHVQRPGEIMYMPATWWHAVRNEEPSLALSENFINAVNAKYFLKPSVIARFYRYADHPFWVK